ncbi:4Fe-4S dicluster domain-containing protein [Chloroflexota bacterium]
MTRKYLLVDLKYCNGCHTCEVACKQEHSLPVGTNWIKVLKIGPKISGNNLRTDYVPWMCMNCPTAPCIEICPQKAITRRPDGIVLVDAELCIGKTCSKCVEACRIGVMQINPEKDKAEKCNMCVDRIDAGLQPACVVACPSKCMHFGEMNDFRQNIIKRLYYFTLVPDFTENRGMRRWQKGDPVGRKLHRTFFNLIRKTL